MLVGFYLHTENAMKSKAYHSQLLAAALTSSRCGGGTGSLRSVIRCLFQQRRRGASLANGGSISLEEKSAQLSQIHHPL